MRKARALAISAALGAAALAGAGPAAALDARAQRGLTFARTHCAQCHAIGRAGPSPLAKAPAFRTLHTRYPVEDLAESFAEGIVTGHPTMPEWRLDPAQIGDLLAYLRSLED
ncbi:c-type cytochrome [Enterovirga aerilata]|uniref:Cytochrome c n=1 Tax=Enterovirga aerilata TaxID=2730920 RepID=A0A849I8Q8_9HYPH|nr:cytochrome c [Enterovirga sp. DB1703]NNM73778.1 cytochrome c [Enterovirga sp. DB1703]